MTFRVRNTAEHFVAVGDVVVINEVEYRILTIEPAKNDTTQILTFGMILVPELVDITVKRVEK